MLLFSQIIGWKAFTSDLPGNHRLRFHHQSNAPRGRIGRVTNALRLRVAPWRAAAVLEKGRHSRPTHFGAHVLLYNPATGPAHSLLAFWPRLGNLEKRVGQGLGIMRGNE
jgi:hypothetical protein